MRFRLCCLFLLILSFLFFNACSTLKAAPVKTTSEPVIENQKYVLAVRTGDPGLDKILYEYCYREFSQVLPIIESGEYTGIIEVIFTSAAEGYFITSRNTVNSAEVYSQSWFSGYSGFGYVSKQGRSSTVTSSSAFVWQNSIMLVTVKRKNGERIWNAEYQYKGGWEMSSWVVHTPAEAASLCAERMGGFIRDAFKNVK